MRKPCPKNWSINAVPEPEDDVYFVDGAGAAEIGVPQYGLGNMLGFDGPEEFEFEEAPVYAGLHVLGYTSTITLDMPLNVGTLDMKADGGVIDQPYGTSSEITITSHFNWTAGTLNSTSVASTVTLSGGAGEITPDDSVSTGSTLKFTSGAAATVSEGSVSFTGGVGTIVESASLIIQPVAGTATFSNNASGTSATLMMNFVGFGGSIKVSGGVWESTNDFPVYNDGGTFEVGRNATAWVTGLTGPAGTRGSYFQRGATGILLLNPMSALRADNVTTITGGRLYTITSPTRAGRPVIYGRLNFAGDEIVLGHPDYTGGAAHAYTGLDITGDFYWTGGVFRPFVGWLAPNTAVNDLIKCERHTSIVMSENGPKIGPVEPTNPQDVRVAGHTWDIITSATMSWTDENGQAAVLVPLETQGQVVTWSTRANAS